MLLTGIITQVSQEETKQGKPYCKVQLLTPLKRIVNVWGCSKEAVPLYRQFSANVKENDQGLSCSYSEVEFSNPTEEQFSWIPKPPTEDEWKVMVTEAVKLMQQYGCSEKETSFFREQALKLYVPFRIYPAGKSNHHSYEGGLARHTYEILTMYISVCNALPFATNPFIVCVAALFHDAAKIRCYKTRTFDYTEYGSLVNHVAGSASMLEMLMRQEDFNERLIMFCTHCVLAHHGRLEWGSPVLPSCVEAHVLALLDEMSGHGVQIYDNATLEGTRVSNLGRTVFKYE